jgi:hypothetical protein
MVKRGIIVSFFLVLLVGCASYLSVSDIDDSHIGKEIQVKGELALHPIQKCTLQICNDDPCCRSCSAGAILLEGEKYLEIKGIECSGNNCEMSCGELEVGKVYIITGILQDSNTIEMTSYKNEE